MNSGEHIQIFCDVAYETPDHFQHRLKQINVRNIY